MVEVEHEAETRQWHQGHESKHNHSWHIPPPADLTGSSFPPRSARDVNSKTQVTESMLSFRRCYEKAR
jgi:hypothetical protein